MRKSYDIAMTNSEQLQNFDKNYELRIESALTPGPYKLLVEISNKTGKSQSKRTYNIEI
jgi:hypothetical protein